MIIYLALTILLGIVSAFGVLLVVPVLFDSQRLSNLYANIAMKIGKRCSLVLEKNGELKWRRMKTKSIGSEKVSMNGDTITLTDPDRSVIPFFGKPFAIGDSYHGVIFTPIHAAMGNAKQRLETRNTFTIPATKEERKNYRILGYIQDRLFVPKNYVADLRDVRWLATGQEFGNDPDKGRTFYKFIKKNLKSNLAFLKMLIPFALFIVFMIMWWQILGGSGGGSTESAPSGGGNSTNGTVINLLLFSLGGIPHRKKLLAVGLTVAFFVVLFALSPVIGILAILFFLCYVIGLAIGIGAFLLFGLALGGIGFGGVTSGMLFSSSLWLIDSPSIILTTDGYELRDVELNGPTHKFGRHGIQFGYTEGALQQFEGYLCEKEDYDMPDGIDKKNNNVRGQVAYVEGLAEEPDLPGYYVSMAGALSALATGFVGKATDKEIQKAKKDFGDGVTGMANTTVMYLSFASMVLSIICAVVFY